MIPLSLPALRCCRTLCISLLTALPYSAVAEILPEDGPVGFEPKTYPAEKKWQELGGELPPWPELKRSIEMDVDGVHRGYRLYIDPQSLSAGKDRVVRFTSVMVSPSGVWNVTYEGLHCGKQRYRRIAFGVNGTWHELPDSSWQELSGSGGNRYRSSLYYHYMCTPIDTPRDVDDILRRLRSVRPVIGD